MNAARRPGPGAFRAALLSACLSAGCQAGWVAHTREVRGAVASERFAEAAALAEARADDDVKREPLLAELERGALLHDSGRHAESSVALMKAEDELERFYRRSLGGKAAQGLVSGVSGSYLGEDHERVWVNVLLALDFLALGKRDDALVEARRITSRLGVLSDVKGHGRRYTGDPFAAWLAGLLFEDDRQGSDAALSYKDALSHLPPGDSALRTSMCRDVVRATRLARIPLEDAAPCTDDGSPEAQPLGRDEGELVLIHRGGLVPERGERRLSCGINGAGLVCRDDSEQRRAAGTQASVVSIAVPELRPVPFQVRGSKLVVDGKEGPATSVVVDLERIALQNLEDRLPEYEQESTTRAMARLAAGTAAGVGAAALASGKGKNVRTEDAAALGLCIGLVTTAALSETEEADKRSWSTLPAFASVARLRLPAGKHRVKVALQGAGGDAGSFEFGEVTIEPGRRTFLGIRTAR